MKRIVLFICFFFFTTFSSFAASSNTGNFVYISTEGEIIFNGESLGYGSNLIVDGKDFAFEKITDGKIHILFNGKDVGEGYRPQITMGKLLFESEKDMLNTIVFNGKNYGEGYDPLVKDGHFIFFRKIQGDFLRNADQGLVQAYYDGKYYCDAKDETIKQNIQFAGDNIICEQGITSKGTTKIFIVYQGKVIDEGFKPHVSKKHYEYSKSIAYGDKKLDVIFFDGKVLGEGSDFEFSEESYFYIRKNIYGKDEIVFNGTPLGEFKSKETISIKDGHIAFQRDKKISERDAKGQTQENTYPYIYHDGIEKGIIDPSAKVFLAGNHIAFERTLKGYDYDTSGKIKAVDVTYAVYDGRERTAIEKGSLQMDKAGVFGFVKKQTDFDKDESTGEKDSQGMDVLGKYVEKTYVFRGETSGAVKRLTEGEPDSLVVQDGRVAYIKKDTETKNITDSGKIVSVEAEVYSIMIDGVKKGTGDITTLVMDKGQYAFAENNKGRMFLTINGKEQVFPGYSVRFLEKDAVKTVAQGVENSISTSGKLLIQGKTIILLTADKTKLQIVPDEGQSLQSFKNKNLYVKIEKKLFRSKTTGKTISAYKLLSFSTKPFSTTSEKKKTYKGVLEKNENTYTLKVKNSSYTLRIIGGITTSDLESFVGDTIELDAIINGKTLEINSLPR